MLKEEKLKQQTEDAEEMIRLIKQLTDEERRSPRDHDRTADGEGPLQGAGIRRNKQWE